MRGAVRAIRVGCQLVPVFLCTCRYSLIHVAQISIGEGKIPLVVTVDLGSGGAILRGSSPLLGISSGKSERLVKAQYIFATLQALEGLPCLHLSFYQS